MRKLKAFLVVLFAAAMSLALFACGGGKSKGSSIDSATVSSVLELTDSDGKDQFVAKLDTVKVRVRDSVTAEKTDIKGSDCDYTGEPTYHTLGTYSITLTPQENNPDKISATLTVRISHDFGAPDANGKEECAYDHATRTTMTEDVALHYGEFHYGTGIEANTPWTTGSNDKKALTGIPDGVESTAGSSAGIAEHFNHAVYNNDMLGDGDTTKTNRIQLFGADNGGANVPTVTAGQLLPGMSITIKGWAKTDCVTESVYGNYESQNGPLNYSAPSYGIADRYNDVDKDGYTGGSSVIVRSEGWVLYDGIGDPRTLAGLPKVIGASSNGANAGANYGSHSTAQGGENDNPPLGYPADRAIPADYSDWKDWWVFSEGKNLSSTAFDDWTQVEVTWTYTVRNNVGIIEIASVYDVNGLRGDPSTLTSYIKVPTAVRGYYDTIIHGDLSSLLITESSVIETETVASVTVNGLKAGAQDTYLAGQTIDAGKTVDVTYTTLQDSSSQAYIINNSQLYYYKGSLDLAALKTNETELADASKWEVVGDSALKDTMKIFKVEFNRSDKDWRGLVLNAEGESAIKVIPNNVSEAFGYDYNDTHKDNGKAGDAVLSVGTVEDEITARLTLTGASVQKATDGKYYVALKLVGIDAFGASINAATETQKVSVSATAGADNKSVLLLVEYEDKTSIGSVVITGIQTTPIELVLVDPIGFDVTSKVEQATEGWTLDKGGNATLTYTLTEGVEFHHLSIGNADFYLRNLEKLDANGYKSGRYTIKTYSNSNGTVSFTLTADGYDFATLGDMPTVRFYGTTGSGDAKVLAEDVLNYKVAISSDNEHVSNGSYFYADSSKLYVIRAVNSDNVQYTAEAFSVNSLPVIINNGGDIEDVVYLGLGYHYHTEYEEFEFFETLPEGITLDTKVFGTANYAHDKDLGALVIISIDIEKVTGLTGAYSFQVAPDANTKVYFTAENGTITKHDIQTGVQRELIQEGDCYTTGIVASKVMSGSDVVFYANYSEVGGQHIDNGHGKCVLCGATISAITNFKGIEWFNNAHTFKDFHEGEELDVWGIYETAGSNLNGTISSVIDVLESGTWNNVYHINGTGFGVWADNNGAGGWGTQISPYADVTGFEEGKVGFYSSLITEDHPYNTINGVKDTYGNEISGDTLHTAMIGGYFRYTYTFINGTIKLRIRQYEPGFEMNAEPFCDYYFTIKTEAKYTYNVIITYSDAGVTLKDNTFHYVRTTVEHSLITDVTTDDITVDTHTVPATKTAEYAVAGTTVTATGTATQITDDVKTALNISGNTYTHYVAFDIALSGALADGTTAVIRDAEKAVVEKAYVHYAEQKISVVIPLTKGVAIGTYTVDLTNYSASTLQSDITLDLSGLAASDTTVTANTANLVLGESTFTLTYNEIPSGAKMSVNDGEAKAVAANTDLGSGLKITNVASNVVTITKSAADLTKAIPSYEIKLLDSNDALLALATVGPAVTIGSGDSKVIGSTEWHYQVGGTTLILYANSTTGETVKATVNAGHLTDVDLLGEYDISTKITEGAISFKEANALTRISKTVYTASGSNGLQVIVIDLKTLGVGSAATPYGFALTESSNMKYYLVDAESNVTNSTATAGEGTTEIRKGDCVYSGVKAHIEGSSKDTSTFYYGFDVTPATGHAFNAEPDASPAADKLHGYDSIYTCTHEGCGAVKYVQATTKSWGAVANAWGAESWTTIAPLHKGGSYTISGTNASSEAHEWCLPEPGITDVTDTNASGFRLDHYVQGDNKTFGYVNGQPTGDNTDLSFELYDNKTSAASTWEKITAAAVQAVLDGATVKYTFDYTHTDKLLLIVEFTGAGDTIHFTETWTITKPAVLAKDTVYIAIHNDENKYTASSVETVVPKNKDVPTALSKHVHTYDATTHRCKDDGALDPAHTTHTYDQNSGATCGCGAINPSHTHSYTEGYCTVCGHVQAGAISYELGGKTYTGTLADQDIVNNDKSVEDGGNGLAWWAVDPNSESDPKGNLEGYSPASSTVAVAAGDFLLVWNWTQLTIDPLYPHDAVIEMFKGDDYIDQGFMQSSGAWGKMMEAIKASCQETITHDGQPAAVPAGADATGYYTVKVARIGTTLVIEQIIVNAHDGSVWKVVDTYTGADTSAWTACITGNPYGCENLKGYYTALTEKQA